MDRVGIVGRAGQNLLAQLARLLVAAGAILLGSQVEGLRKGEKLAGLRHVSKPHRSGAHSIGWQPAVQPAEKRQISSQNPTVGAFRSIA